MYTTLLIRIVMLLCPVGFLISPVSGQTQTRVVQWAQYPIGSRPASTSFDLLLSRQIEGVEIQGIAVAGKTITVGESFSAEDDWLRDLTIRVKNISDRHLVSIQLNLVVPQIKVSPQIVFCYGCASAESGKGIMPGEEVTLKMPSGGFYDWYKTQISKELPLSRVSKAQVDVIYVTLPGGSKWFSGCMKTADPKNACPHKDAP